MYGIDQPSSGDKRIQGRLLANDATLLSLCGNVKIIESGALALMRLQISVTCRWLKP